MESHDTLRRELAHSQQDILDRKIRQGELVRKARRAGMSWPDISRSVGMSSAAVAQRWDERQSPHTLRLLELQREKVAAVLLQVAGGQPNEAPEQAEIAAAPVDTLLSDIQPEND